MLLTMIRDTAKPPPPDLSWHLRNLAAVSRENARLANETPLTAAVSDEITRRST